MVDRRRATAAVAILATRPPRTLPTAPAASIAVVAQGMTDHFLRLPQMEQATLHVPDLQALSLACTATVKEWAALQAVACIQAMAVRLASGLQTRQWDGRERRLENRPIPTLVSANRRVVVVLCV